jgi:aminoglycoside phosphotransferase (APT) family kinase protein
VKERNVVQPQQPLALGRTAEIYAWGDGQILKLFRSSTSGSQANYEAALTSKLEGAGLPVPAVRGVTYVRGRYGILFERLEGPTMLAELQRRPWLLPRLARLMAQLHSNIHQHSLEDLPSLVDHVERAIGRTTLSELQQQELVNKLHTLPEGNVVCHQDFHPDNILLTKRGPVVLDWPTARSGNPIADVARTFLLLKIAAPLPGAAQRWLIGAGRGLFRSLYLQRYGHLQGVTQQQLEAWLSIMAAVRLVENVPGEQAQLMAIINTHLRSS